MTEDLPQPSTGLPPLDSEPEERRSIRPWHLALIGLVAGYPLSVGPVAWICETLDPARQYTGFIRIAYQPLTFLYDRLLPVRVFYDWYLGLFGVR